MRAASWILALAAAQSPAQAPGWEARADEAAKAWARAEGPGGVVGVAVDGKVVYAKGFGLASLEHSVPNAADTVMDVGSVSKQFTAMCVLLLEEGGKLKTSDPVTKYVPELPKLYDPVTLDHLLHMTGGVRDYLTIWMLEGWNGTDARSPGDVLDTLARQQALNFEPGTRFLYSNSNYVLLATVVERASGKSLASFARDAIFKPLGMDSTQFDTDGPAVPRRATSYQARIGGFHPMNSALQVVGDGGVLSTVADLAKWHANLLANKLGKADPALVKKLTTPGTPPGSPLAYACGLVVDSFRGAPRIGHNGNWLGFNAATVLFPDRKTSVFALGNDGRNDCGEIAQKVSEIVLGLPPSVEEDLKPVPVDRAHMERIAQRYALPDGRILTIRLVGDQLKLQVAGQPEFDLHPAAEDAFFIRAPRVLVRALAGKVTLKQGDVELELEPVAPYEAGEADLKAWAGSYTSAEVATGIRITVEGNSLKVEYGDGQQLFVRPAMPDRFVSPLGSAVLVRDAQGTVRGFVLDAGRANGLRFVRRG